MLLAFTLLFGLSVPASAEFGTQDSANLKSISDDVFGISNAFRADNFTWDQNNNANMNVMSYMVYVLRSLKGAFKNSGTLVSMTPDNGSGVGYVYDASKDYFVSTWVGSRPTVTATDANRWRVQTLSDNHSGSWLYQVAHSLAQSGLTMEALMNWSNPDGGTLYMPSTSAPYSWFNQMLTAVNGSKADTSLLATEATLDRVRSSLSYLENFVLTGNSSYFEYSYSNSKYKLPLASKPLDAINRSLFNFASLFVPTYNSKGSLISPGFHFSYIPYAPDKGSSLNTYYATDAFMPALFTVLKGYNFAFDAINDNLLGLDEILATENDRALEAATDDTKVNVKDYVTGKKSNYGDSFTIGDTISVGLKPDLSTAQASSAVGGLFSPDSSDYWGWFSSATDSDLHPAASGVSTLSLEDEPSSQDVADSETVWVINPYSSASDVVSDFFGGE